jgi:hypothetical protein
MYTRHVYNFLRAQRPLTVGQQLAQQSCANARAGAPLKALVSARVIDGQEYPPCKFSYMRVLAQLCCPPRLSSQLKALKFCGRQPPLPTCQQASAAAGVVFSWCQSPQSPRELRVQDPRCHDLDDSVGELRLKKLERQLLQITHAMRRERS